MDLIDREAALAYPLSWEHYDKEHGNRHFICGVESYRDYIEELPSAEPKTASWIPVTERLPEEGEMVLFTEGDEYPYTVIVGCIERGKWEYRDDMSTAQKPKPIAWMPLPEPYNGADMRGE